MSASLATRCSACGTVFRVVTDQLRVSDGWVRCGRCDAVFDAIESLFDLDTGQAARVDGISERPPVEAAPATAGPGAPTGSAAAGRAGPGSTVPTPPESPHPQPPLPDPAARVAEGDEAAPARAPGTPDPARVGGFGPPLRPARSASPATGPSAHLPANPPAAPPASAATAAPAQPPTPSPAHPLAPAPDTPPLNPLPAAAGPSRTPGAAAPPAADGVLGTSPLSAPETAAGAQGLPGGDTLTDPAVASPWPTEPGPAGMPPAVAAVADVAEGPGPGEAPATHTGRPEPRLADQPVPSLADDPPGPPTDIMDRLLSPSELAADHHERPPRPSFVRDAERAAFWRRPAVRATLALSALLLAVLLALQSALWWRDSLAAQAPALQPLLTALCARAGCQITPLRRIEALSVESSGLNRIDGSPGRYLLQVALRNRADTALLLPALDLTLTDNDGRLVARRVLQGADLGLAPGLRVIAGGQELPIRIVLATAEQLVDGYTLELFYP